MKHRYKNFFLSYQGVCLKFNFLLFDSVHLYPLAVYKQYKRALVDLVIAKYSRTGKYKVLDKNETYLVVNHPWFNYYHWIIESIPRIVRYDGKHKDLTLILPQAIFDCSFVKDSLLPFNFKNIELNDEGWHYHVPNGIISPIQKFCYRYDPLLINKTRELYLNYFVGNDKVEPFRKIYVSRINAPRRKFSNEEEVIALMKSFNFEIIELENTTLKEQVRLFSETKLLVAMHGAALSNMLFMSSKTSVVELYRKRRTIFELKSKVYKNLSPVLEIIHNEIACDPVNKKDDFFTGDLVVDLHELKTHLQFILNINKIN